MVEDLPDPDATVTNYTLNPKDCPKALALSRTLLLLSVLQSHSEGFLGLVRRTLSESLNGFRPVGTSSFPLRSLASRACVGWRFGVFGF